MRTAGTTSLYRHTEVALLRSAVAPLTDAPERWPDPGDTEACRSWLDQMWSRRQLADAIRQASTSLAGRVDAIRAGHVTDAKQIRRATMATARYLLRATGRPTPFGLFAGVAPVALGHTAAVRWGDAHRPVVRADTQWLADVIDRLEASSELVECLDVVFNNLAARRGGRLEAPSGPNRVRIRYTKAVQAIRTWAASPVQFSVLADRLLETFDSVDQTAVRTMVVELVRQGFLVTCLRAPCTITDPLGHLVDRLASVGADALPSVSPLLRELEAVRAEVKHHNHHGAMTAHGTRDGLKRRMRELSHAGRTPLAVDLLLDCVVRLPVHVAHEVQRAAGALLRLSRHPTGPPAWRSYHAAFCDKYGTGTLVPLADVLDPDGGGLGYPPGYPGSILPAPADVPSERDERLLALAWQAIVDRGGEIVLTEKTIDRVTGGERLDDRYIPPHVEVAGRVHAASVQALDGGEYTLTIAPARAGGVLTSRFTPTTTGSGLEEVYRSLPVVIEGAVPAQMSFPPAYPHAENICRVPAYLSHLLPLGEHRRAEDDGTPLPLDDLAITATRDRLHLVSTSRRRVVEPQVFHALAMDKQAPPLARFLSHLPRAFTTAWTVLDWGPYADRLPYLPRVRYRRCVLSPARWRLTSDDLHSGEPGRGTWRKALDAWRERWRCPSLVDLRDDDRTLRLNLDEPIHATILHAHLMRHGHAIITDADAEFGWFGNRAHEFVLPLVATRSAAPSPLTGSLPVVTNNGHGQMPGEADATWLYAKLHAHPERHDELIAEHLPALLATLGGEAACWFVRYRSPHETDHLRLRLRIPEPGLYGPYAAAVGAWARGLRREGLAGHLVLDSYQPEVGRYGHGPAMDAAEAVFVADSRAVAAALRHLPVAAIHPTALTGVSMVHIVSGFLGCNEAMAWLADHPAPAGSVVERAIAEEAVRLAQPGALRDSTWPEAVADAWQARSAALAVYRSQLAADADVDAVVESLLHMHHNRAIGIDQGSEHTCRRLARLTALAWRARVVGAAG